MKLFECQHCRQPLYFENTACVNCGHRVGYSPDAGYLLTLEPEQENGIEVWRNVGEGQRTYLFCDNARHDVCNWLVPADAPTRYCAACRHNHTVPDLSIPDNQTRWTKLEIAKHYLFYGLIALGLPHPTRAEDPREGLVFDFLAETTGPDGSLHKVLTGHDNGDITINIVEADDVERERRRADMGEPYRTLLGHFRHEIGHYYWDRLVRDNTSALAGFRALFGDESQDYNEALKHHYEVGPPAGWQEHYVSAYATTHPWEDWAETWAHYLHIIDTLETAQSFGLSVKPRITIGHELSAELRLNPYRQVPIGTLIDTWLPLGFAMNSISRSMGQSDLYPFVLSPPVIEKLGFINTLLHGERSEEPVSAQAGEPAQAEPVGV